MKFSVSKASNRNDIQGLRAVAVLLVIFAHLPNAGKIPGGFVGVDIFFVISGYVIMRQIILNKSTTGKFTTNYSIFLSRRFVRLVPALSATVITTLLLALIFSPPREQLGIQQSGFWSETFLSNFYFLKNFDSYWNPEILRNPFLHTWSLGVEFQTYLFFPIILIFYFIGTRLNLKAKTLNNLILGVAIILSLFIFLYLLHIRSTPIWGMSPAGIAFYSPLARFWEFGIGIGAAILATENKTGILTKKVFGFLGLGLMLTGLFMCNFYTELSWAVIPMDLGTAIFIIRGETAIPKIQSMILASKPFVWIGDRSYSIYLWHWPLLVLALWIFPGQEIAVLFALFLTLVLAEISFKFLEQKIKFVSSYKISKNLRKPALFAVITFLFIGSCTFISEQDWYSPEVSLSSISTPFAEPSVTSEQIIQAMDRCTWEELSISCDFYSPEEPTVVVIGDSLGVRSFPAVALAARENGFNAHQMWTGGCGIEFNSCPDFIYEYLATTKVAGLIITSNFDRASSVINGDERASGKSPICSLKTLTVNCNAHKEAVKSFTEKAKQGLSQLEKYTPNILLALPFPQQEFLLSNCTNPPIFQTWIKVFPKCGSTSLKWQELRQGLFPNAMRNLVNKDPRVTLWDPTAYLCNKETCPSVINDGEQIMDDSVHWSHVASRFLFPEFESFISKLPDSKTNSY